MTKQGLRNLTARTFIRALERDGFFCARSTGSHRIYRHSDKRQVAVAFHAPGDTFPPGTLASMLHATTWTEMDFIRLELISE